MEYFTHDKLDELKIKFVKIQNLEDYQHWKYNVAKLLDSVYDKESMTEFLQYQEKRVEVKLNILYKLYIDTIAVLLVTFLFGNFFEKLIEISKNAAIIILIISTIVLVYSIAATIYNERKLLFYKKCLNIIQHTTKWHKIAIHNKNKKDGGTMVDVIIIMLVGLLLSYYIILMDDFKVSRIIFAISILVLLGVYFIALNNEREDKIQTIRQKIDEQGLDKTVVELYTGYDSINDMADLFDLPKDEIIGILRDNDAI